MKQKKTRISWGGVALLVCGLLALVGFLAAQTQRASAATPAFVRIIHASPYVGTADVFLDGSPLLTSFVFGAVTDYAAIPAGPHKVQIALVGKGIGASALTETLAVQPGAVYTVAATGTSPQTLALQVFSDNNIAVSGTAKVRVYQISPDGGKVTTSTDGQSVAPAVTYQQASDYFTQPAGPCTLNLTSAPYAKSLSIALTLKVNTVTSIFMVGLFNGSPRVQLVSAQVAAVPGLPQTGSNPLAFLSDGQLSTPWLLIALGTLFVGGTLFTRRLFVGH